MFAFAGSVFLMALYNLGAGGVTVSNVLVGMLVFAGGITLILVAMWEIVRGNTMFATGKRSRLSLPALLPLPIGGAASSRRRSRDSFISPYVSCWDYCDRLFPSRKPSSLPLTSRLFFPG